MACMSQNFLSKIDRITPAMFAKEIDKIVRESKMDHIQAVLYYCEKNRIDLESVPQLLNSSLKQKIELVAQDLHLLPKTSKLPL
jgi:hypothetical protein